jgi:hypothetical protein
VFVHVVLLWTRSSGARECANRAPSFYSAHFWARRSVTLWVWSAGACVPCSLVA